MNLYLFVRKFKVTDNSTEPYIYIGKGDVTSFHGNKPITTEITLHHEVPMSLYLEFTLEFDSCRHIFINSRQVESL
ncbi:DUF3427 domain-containing protein [Sporolactobacillus vineae]|uniref:DUF3427 domain-containing protein n=1 Tax=Sporolactobacillus vineae TaxID=444463 RepID=UPI001EE65DEB|nr:DUF3427 domain-containing protein [Sporolactobacillus vineae]